MRLKFIEYIINAACCECRCGAHDTDRSFIVMHFEKSETKIRIALELFAKVSLVSDVASNNIKLWLQSNAGSEQNPRVPTILQTRHEIFNGSELNRDGKVNFLISGDASLPAESVESAGKGSTESLISVIYLATRMLTPAPPRNIPPTPSRNLAPSERVTFPSAALAVSL